jgi:hypothetical protein
MSQNNTDIEDIKEEEIEETAAEKLKSKRKEKGYGNHKALPFRKEDIELIIAECMNQTKLSLDVLASQIVDKNEDIKMTQRDNLLATFRIMEFEMQNVLDALEGFNDASLTKKHRMCRQIIQSYVKKLRNLAMWEVRSIKNKKCMTFAKLCTSFLTDMHKMMHADTSPKVRKTILERVCG